MPRPTLEMAYELARSGRYATVADVQARLKEEGCHAVDTLLAARSIRSHLAAICAASTRSTPTPD